MTPSGRSDLVGLTHFQDYLGEIDANGWLTPKNMTVDFNTFDFSC